MKRLFLTFLNAPLLILLVTAGLAVQSSLFASYPLMLLQPDIVLLAVIWCALRRGFTEGGILTLIFAAVAEASSAAPQGFFLTCYMALYLGMRMFARFFVISRFSALIMVTMGASAAWKASTLLLLAFLDSADNQWRHTLLYLIPGAVVAGIFGIWVFRLLDKFDQATYKTDRSQQIIEDELLVEEGI